MIGIALLGADRVGKTTLVAQLEKLCRAYDTTYLSLHFSGPRPHHESVYDQYLEPFSKLKETPDVVLFDRFTSEAPFYESWRRRFYDEDWQYKIESCEKKLLKIFDNDLKLYYLCPPWGSVHQRHIEEIDQLYGEGMSSWYKHCFQLTLRYNEHIAYYEFMKDYWNNFSHIPNKVMLNNAEYYTVVLDYLESRLSCNLQKV